MAETGKPLERRRNPRLRDAFEAACSMVEPFFDQANTWDGQPLEQLAYHALREHFPEASSEDVRIFLNAVKRVQREKHCR